MENERGKKRMSFFFLFAEKHVGVDVWFVKGREGRGE